MADILLDEQTAPAAPSAGQGVIWPNTAHSKPMYRDDSGNVIPLAPRLTDANHVADVTSAAADTYVTGSGILIPSTGFHVGMCFRWTIGVNKTAAGVAAGVVTVRMGAAKATSDTSRIALTGAPVQAATAAGGILTVQVVVRTVAASGVIHGAFGIACGSLAFGGGAQAAGAGFDNQAVGGQYIGLSINSGTAGSWVFGSVLAELVG